jgi:hypothetical protein
LQDALNRERANAAQSGKDAHANQKRQELLENRLAATRNESVAIDKALSTYEAQLKLARSEYEQALVGLKAAIAPAPKASP